jgi:hypothetical protein
MSPSKHSGDRNLPHRHYNPDNEPRPVADIRWKKEEEEFDKQAFQLLEFVTKSSQYHFSHRRGQLTYKNHTICNQLNS